jgi:hypothetical protein
MSRHIPFYCQNQSPSVSVQFLIPNRKICNERRRIIDYKGCQYARYVMHINELEWSFHRIHTGRTVTFFWTNFRSHWQSAISSTLIIDPLTWLRSALGPQLCFYESGNTKVLLVTVKGSCLKQRKTRIHTCACSLAFTILKSLKLQLIYCRR